MTPDANVAGVGDDDAVRPGTLLEPAVAAVETALHVLRRTPGLDPVASREAEEALKRAHGGLIQQWFGPTTGQDVLFGGET